jgi:hypothetical protein
MLGMALVRRLTALVTRHLLVVQAMVMTGLSSAVVVDVVVVVVLAVKRAVDMVR